MPKYQATIYGHKEEQFNIWSHGLGFVASVVGTVLLLARALDMSDPTYAVSAAVYGASLLTLYAASTLYHSAQKPKLRNRLNIFDHAAIYILIAGTYTPFCLITLAGTDRLDSICMRLGLCRGRRYTQAIFHRQV